MLVLEFPEKTATVFNAHYQLVKHPGKLYDLGKPYRPKEDNK